MFDSDDIIYAARTLRPHLRGMLGGSMATVIERDVDDLLQRADRGEKVDNLILERLTQEDQIRDWLKTALPIDTTRELALGTSYEPLPGNAAVLPGNVRSLPTLDYACPREGCHFKWHLRIIGRPVPACPVHKIKLDPIGEEK